MLLLFTSKKQSNRISLQSEEEKHKLIQNLLLDLHERTFVKMQNGWMFSTFGQFLLDFTLTWAQNQVIHY